MMSTGFNVIGFFRGVFESFNGLVRFLNTPIIFKGFGIVLNPTQEQISKALNNGVPTPLNLLSYMLVAFLVVTLALHVWHLLKLVL